MMNDDAGVATLHASVQSHKNTVDRLMRQIDEANTHYLSTIRGAYVAQLAMVWREYSNKHDRPASTAETLQHQVDALTDFTDRFYEIVQEPRLSAIAQDLTQWLAAWTEVPIDWQAYLRYAANEQLEEIEAQLGELELPDFDEKSVEDLARRWIKYQAGRLHNTEKLARHVVDWLSLVGQNLANARRLVDELLTLVVETAPDEAEHALLTDIRRRWVEQLQLRIASAPIEVESFDLNEHLAPCEEEWRRIQGSLPNLTVVLATCSKAELTMVQNQIDSWQTVGSSEIDELLEVIADVRAIEAWHAEHAAFLGAVSIEAEDLTAGLQTLIDARPKMPKPDDQSSFGEYHQSTSAYQENVERWLVQCQEYYDDMQAKVDRWHNSMWPEDVLQALPERDDHPDAPISLEQLARMSSQLRATDERASAFADQSLDPAEREVWQRLQALRQDGRKMVDLTELTTEETVENVATALATLANRNLIKVTIDL